MDNRLKPRNWVAKNNFNRPVRHRDRTQYQRRDKHVGRQRELLQERTVS